MAFFRYSGDYYISPAGNDANSGTSPNAPFATIQAAFDAAGNTNGLTFVIGSGTYNEALSTPFSNTSTYSWVLQGDGEVIINGDGVSQSTNSAIGYDSTNRGFTYNDITFANWIYSFNGLINQNYNGYQTWNRCKFINIDNMWKITSNYTQTFINCVFVKTYNGKDYISTGHHIFRKCVFISSAVQYYNGNNEPTGTDQGSTYNNNGVWNEISDCIFVNPFQEEKLNYLVVAKMDLGYVYTQHSRRFYNNVFDNNGVISNARYSTNNVATWTSFTQSTADFVNEIDTYGSWLDSGSSGTGPALNNADVTPYTNLVYDLSFNDTLLTGSTDLFKTLGAPYSIDFSNTNYFAASQHPATRTIANAIPAVAYGTNDDASNPFHTTGGATWSNIIATGSGFIISSSTLISGTIESAVIDQGTSKTINDIEFNWSTNDANQGVISYYTASDTIQNYQLRYGDAADLSSEEYKLFPLNGIPYLDANGSGSGDINFVTGSTGAITARYLQFKLTLRNDWNGG